MKNLIHAIILIIFSLWLLLSPKASRARGMNIDSLKSCLKQVKLDSNGVKTVYAVAKFYTPSTPDSVIAYSLYGIVLCKKMQNEEYEAGFRKLLGIAYAVKGQYSEALTNNKIGIELYAKFPKRISALAEIYCNLGIAYNMIEDYENALIAYQNSLDISIGLNDYAPIARVKMNMGNTYNAMGDHEKAIKSFKEVLTILPNNPRWQGLKGVGYQNIGSVMRQQKDFNSAKVYIKKGLHFSRKSNDVSTIIVGLVTLGDCHESTGEYTKAINYYQEALEYAKSIENHERETRIYLDISFAYTSEGNFPLAMTYIDSAAFLIDSLDENSKPDVLRYFYRVKSRLLYLMGDYKEAYAIVLRHDTLKESILNEKIIKNTQSLDARYQTRLKQDSIAILGKQAELDQAQLVHQEYLNSALTSGLIFAIVFVFAVILAAIYLYSLNKKIRVQSGLLKFKNSELEEKNSLIESQNQHLEEQNKKIEMQNREIYHNTSNNLSVLIAILELQRNLFHEIEDKFAIEDLQTRIDTIGSINRLLFKQEEMMLVDLSVYLPSLISAIETLMATRLSRKVELHIEIPAIMIDPQFAANVGLIVNELLLNSYKHAFLKVEKPDLVVAISAYDSACLHIMVKDNGVGIHSEQIPLNSRGFGLTFIEDLVARNHGRLEIASEAGTKFDVYLKSEKLLL